MQPSPMQPSPLQTSPLHSSITPSRRGFVTGAALTALLAAAGCATQPGYFDIVEAVRRLMQASADRAFARLIAPGGFYDDQVARLNLPAQFEGRAGRIADRILRSNAMRDRMMRSFSEVIIAFTGVDLGAIADDLAHQADGAIWREIGRQEAVIRADPRATNDPVLIRLFGR
jgi:hypothetical protein